MGISSFIIFSSGFAFLRDVRRDLGKCGSYRFDMEVLGVVGMKMFEDGKVIAMYRKCRSE